MKIYKGETGLAETWQMPFLHTIKCKKCGGKARILFTAIENDRDEENDTFITESKKGFLCDLHETTGEKGGLWLHDACAVAVYLCQDCFEANAEINQA